VGVKNEAQSRGKDAQGDGVIGKWQERGKRKNHHKVFRQK
jgi:hypothetical protein